MDAVMQKRRVALWGLAACSCVALLLLVRISAFGIWDPWELGTADAARKLASGQGAGEPFDPSVWIVSRGFALFGIHEWAGRLPIALCGVLAAFAAFALGTRYGDLRCGVYAALIAGTSPLFVFNSRAMLGEAPAFASQALLGLCALRALSPRGDDRSPALRGGSQDAREPRRAAWLWFLALLLAAAAAVWIQGALLGALPPLLAAVVVSPLATPERRPRAVAWAGALLLTVFAVLIARDVLRDSSQASLWLGGRVAPGTPPTFDHVFEEIFHAFAPWSALLPLAVGQLWLRSSSLEPGLPAADRGEAQLGLFALIWAGAGYGVQTFFLSRYGSSVSYLPLVALALLVALFLRGIEREGQPSWALAIAALFLTGLVLRDYSLYPNGPVNGMPLTSFELPKVFNPKRIWAVLLGAFAVSAFFGLGVTQDTAAALRLGAPYRFLRAQWARGLAFRAWLVALALVLLGLVVFGVLAYAIPDRLRMPTVALRWVKRLVFSPLVLIAAIGVAQLALWGFGKLGNYRFAPLLASGLAFGIYAAHGFLPALSGHFSPREVYSTFNALAAKGEALGEYNVGGRAAAYYAKGEVIDLDGVSRLIEHLTAPGRRWAAFPAEELPEIDRRFRQHSRQHLFVADARSARVVLVTNRPIPGRRDENFLRDVVRSSAPERIQHPVSINFEKRIELLGYDLVLPHDGYVGAGESFTLRWYFRAIQHGLAGYKVFVHIDGQGQRIHGDHEPVDGKYALQLWDPGDFIVDEQKLDVPANFRAGDYTIYMGFYSGETRLNIESGPNDGGNRAIAGVLRIQ